MVHRRQYVIANKKYERDDFKYLKLKNKMYLSYQKDLKISYYEDEKNLIILLGSAFQSIDSNLKPEEELKYITLNNIEEKIGKWSGRWILIYNNNLYLDATGNLQAFYGRKGEEVFCSSSLSLLQEMFNIIIDKEYKKIEHRIGMDWYPGPETLLGNVNRLKYNEKLKIDKKNLEIDKIKSNYKNKIDLTRDEKIKEISEKLVTILKNVQKEYGEKIFLPITAGQDSRTILAACLGSNISFSCFTMEHGNISIADRKLPLKLSKEFNFKYNYIKRERKKLNLEKLNEFDKHTFEQCVDEDRKFYSFNQFEEISKREKKGIILRGGIWEFAREYYFDLGVKFENTDKALQILEQKWLNIVESKYHKVSLKAWLESIEDDNINFRDRFYLEQRIGCWLASIEQGLDLIDYERIHPVNCREILYLLNSFSQKDKEKNIIQKNIIKYLEPKLLIYPFNEVYYFMDKWNRLIINLKIEGGKSTVKKIIKKIIKINSK